MKKLISVVSLIAILAVMMTACGKFECDLCGEESSGKKYKDEILGQEIVYCKDCHNDLEDLGNALG